MRLRGSKVSLTAPLLGLSAFSVGSKSGGAISAISHMAARPRHWPPQRRFATKSSVNIRQCRAQSIVEFKRRNNKSGLAGVCRYIYPGVHVRPAVQRGYWLAFWTLAPGKGKRIKFSIDRFGERGALKRAMRARKEALAALDGQWVNSEGLRHWLRAHCNASGSQREASRISGKR